MPGYDISVIIPAYNAEKYIGQCLDSLLAQTKDSIEIVVVNDGSTDGTPQILERYAAEHGNIVCVNQKNGGLAAARVAGLKAATGEYVGWSDADDFVRPEMFATLYDLAQKEGADSVYCDYEFYPAKVATKEKWFKKYNGRRDWEFIDRNTQCWNTLTKRSLLEQIRIAEAYPKFGEYSWILVLLFAKKIAYTNEKLYYYRVGGETMSGGGYKNKLAHFEQGARRSSRLKEMIAGTEYEQPLAEYFDYRYIYTLIQLEIVAAVNSSPDAYRRAAAELKRLRFRKNPLTKRILDANHGGLKSFVMRNLITLCYPAARLITKVVF